MHLSVDLKCWVILLIALGCIIIELFICLGLFISLCMGCYVIKLGPFAFELHVLAFRLLGHLP